MSKSPSVHAVQAAEAVAFSPTAQAPTAEAQEPPSTAEAGTSTSTTASASASAPASTSTSTTAATATATDHGQIVNAGEEPGTIEPESGSYSDNDSSYGEEALPDTASITSSIYAYKYENGRRYHAYSEGQYLLPNDDREQDRLDMAHHMYLMIHGGELHMAPLTNPQRILEIGTGTGIWAIGIADQYPSAEVIGIDLSPIQPQWIPPNCEFQVDNAELPWTFPAEKPFDLVFMGNMGNCITDWPALLAQAYQHLAPGGWIEISEGEPEVYTDDDSLPPTSSLRHLNGVMQEACRRLGRKLNVGPELAQRVVDAGFLDVHDDIYKVPQGPWPKDPKMKELGRYMQVHMMDSFDSYAPAMLTRIMGWSMTEVEILVAKCKGDIRNKAYHMYTKK